ncbi:MAG TPA: hypothetical protein PLM14_12115 [Candidatus Hydrogenedentes bacterium]|nr:hypothetical protein [Candidatus Hydrogenedentota bacterium]HQH51520.1 hypothetical protein [Candidatus Hydrogenedentota bacterium]
MKSRSILVRFPGYPFSFEALMPDHELASTAACLLAEGHETVIRDFGTVGLVDRLFPETVRGAVSEIADRFLDFSPVSPLRALHLLWQLRAADRAFQTRQVSCCEELAEKLAETEKVDFIALKIDVADDLHSAILLAKRIRQHNAKVCLLAFGQAAGLYGWQLVSSTGAFDGVCVGDPEVGITALADNIRHRDRWPSLPNLIFPGTDRPCHTEQEFAPDLDALPEPVYDPDVYRALRNNRKLKLFPIEESRGCDNTCSDCPKSTQDGGLRLRSPGRVMSHIQRIVASHGVGAFRIVGAGGSMAHAASVANDILECGSKVAYSRAGNLASANPALLKVLKASGCVSLSYRVGSGSQRLLRDYFGQNAGVSGIESLLRSCKDAGLIALARFTYPTPADDHHTRAETLRLLERARPDAGLVELPEVLPRTLWYQQPWRYGFGLTFGNRLDHILRTRSRFGTPPGRWRSLPYRIGELTATQAIQHHESMLREVESLGIVAHMLEETPLVARVLGWYSSLADFRTQAIRQFLTGDIHGIARMVKDFNVRAATGAVLGQSAHLRAAVGN